MHHVRNQMVFVSSPAFDGSRVYGKVPTVTGNGQMCYGSCNRCQRIEKGNPEAVIHELRPDCSEGVLPNMNKE